VGDVSLKALSNVPTGMLTWRRGEQRVLTVVAKATFVIAPGEVALAPEQEPLSAFDRAYPDGSSRGTYAPADLVPMKPRADVILVGHAYAPERAPRPSFAVRLAVGDLEKRAEVHCDRHFDAQGKLHEGARVASVPLVAERSAGGPETSNPLGARAGVRDAYGRVVVPNVQPPGLHVATTRDTFGAVVFGPVASTWPERVALLGASLAGRAPAAWDGQTLPPDLDPSYFNAAPRDQRVSSLRDGEPLRLEGLHPTHASLTMRLPELRPKAFVEGVGDAPQEVAMRADTLWFETVRGICTMTWRGQIVLPPGATGVCALVAMEHARHPMTWAHVDAKRRKAEGKSPASSKREGPTGTMMPPQRAGVTLPFAKGAAPPETPRQATPRPAQPAVGMPFAGHGPAPPPAPAAARGAVNTVQLRIQDAPGQSPASPPPPAPQVAPSPAPQIAPLAYAPPTPVQPPPIAPQAYAPPPVAAPALVGAPVLPPAPLAVAPPPLAPLPLAAPPVPALPLAALPLSALPLATPAKAAVPVPPAAPRPAATEALRLVGFDSQVLPRLRKDPRFTDVLDALDEAPLDVELDAGADGGATEDVEERREILEILARGPTTSDAELAGALGAAVKPDGRVVAPLAVVVGELQLPFDEVDELRATVAAASVHAGTDGDGRAILGIAKDVLASPGMAGLADVADNLATRIRTTFENKSLTPANILSANVERALVAKRSVQHRAVFGADHVRGVLGGAGATPVYVPAAFGARLPASARVRVRLLAAVHPAIDPADAHPLALRVVALAVAAPIPGGAPKDAPAGRR